MTIVKQIALLMLLFGVSMTLNASPTLPKVLNFRVIDPADGLPSTRVVGIAQDKKGYMWFATEDGLVRYDGIALRTYRYAPGEVNGLPGNTVQAIHVDSQDRLWLAVESEGLTVLEKDRRTFRTFNTANTPIMLDNEVFDIASQKNGDLWFGIYGGGLYRMNSQGRIDRFIHEENSKKGLPSNNIFALAVDEQDKLWVGTSQGLVYWDGKALQRVPNNGPESRVVRLSVDPKAGLWISRASGLQLLGKDGVLTNADALDPRRPNSNVPVLRDFDDNLWVGGGAGLCIKQPSRATCESNAELSGVQVHLIYQDIAGVLWFGVYGQALYTLPSRHSGSEVLYSQADNGEQKPINSRALAADPKHGLWTIDREGSIFKISEKEQRKLNIAMNIADRRGEVQFIKTDNQGRLWILQKSRLLKINPNNGSIELKIEDEALQERNNPARGIEIDANNNLWLFLGGYGFQRRDLAGKLLEDLPAGESSGLPSPDVRSMLIGPDGELWVASDVGVHRWDSALRRFQFVKEIPAVVTFSLSVRGPSVCAHQMLELACFDSKSSTLKKTHAFTIQQGLPATDSYGLLQDRDDAIWLSTVRGLWRFDLRNKQVNQFSVRDGFPTNEFFMSPMVETTDGEYYIASAKGLIHVRPNVLLAAQKHANLVIDSLSLQRNEDRVDLDVEAQLLTLEPYDRELNITARLLAYDDPKAHRFRFKLDGFDSDWIEVDAKGERVFSQLKAGSYQLSVMGSTGRGDWTNPIQIKLKVMPYWWETWWAKSLYALLGFALLYVWFMRYRSRQKERSRLALVIQREELARKNLEAKTKFLTTLGHEIRTPMTSVIGMTELLAHSHLDTQQQLQLNSIRSAGSHLIRLLSDALDLSKIEAGKLEIIEESVDLSVLLNELDGWLRPLSDQKNLRLKITKEQNAPDSFLADSHRLKQILSNLVINAIKFTEQGDVELSVALVRDELHFSVRDSGQGMTSEQVARLFQPFEQAEGGHTAARYGGSGLGLSICRDLATAMKAKIDVQSVLGAGSTFTFILPYKHANKIAESKPLNSELNKPASIQHQRILLVEDDPNVANVVQQYIDTIGHESKHVTHALQAMADANQTDWSLFILDIDLPGLSGIELAKLLRQQGKTWPLIALTARTDVQTQTEAMQAGFDLFLHKPIDLPTLANAIESVLNKKKST
jgi:signal transduction histidine kinase/ligand-binding sensor domain-containing protein/CheY-like chemotaxis protein